MSEYTSHWIVFSNLTDDKQEGILLRLTLMAGDDVLLLHFTSNENSIPTIVDTVIGFNLEPYPHGPATI